MTVYTNEPQAQRMMDGASLLIPIVQNWNHWRPGYRHCNIVLMMPVVNGKWCHGIEFLPILQLSVMFHPFSQLRHCNMNYLKWQKQGIYLSFDFLELWVLLKNGRGGGLLLYWSRPLGAIEMLWVHLWGAPMSSIFICYNLLSIGVTETLYVLTLIIGWVGL